MILIVGVVQFFVGVVVFLLYCWCGGVCAGVGCLFVLIVWVVGVGVVLLQYLYYVLFGFGVVCCIVWRVFYCWVLCLVLYCYDSLCSCGVSFCCYVLVVVLRLVGYIWLLCGAVVVVWVGCLVFGAHLVCFVVWWWVDGFCCMVSAVH